MYIKEIELNNWLIYKGINKISLDSLVYGVIAKYIDNEDRSNWGGKSSLLNAIRFALYGTLPKSVLSADAWIHRGETNGGVKILLSDDVCIERTRTKGKATRLKVNFTNGLEAFDNDAQVLLEEYLCLSSDDFINSCFFEQKQISKFVTSKPSERMDIIAAWLELEPIQKAEKKVRSSLDSLYKKEAEILTNVKVKREIVSHILSQYFDGVDSTVSKQEVYIELQSFRKDILAKQAELQLKLTDQKIWLNQLKEWYEISKKAKQYYTYIESAKKTCDYESTQAELASINLGDIQEHMNVSSGECRHANDQYRQARELVKGEFGGVCPVDGHRCPDAQIMNSLTSESRKRAKDCDTRLQMAQTKQREIKSRYDALMAKQNNLRSLLTSYDWNLKQAEKYKEFITTIEQMGEPGISLEEAEKRINPLLEEFHKCQSDISTLDNAIKSVNDAFDVVEIANNELFNLRNSIKIHQQAVVILGKNGVQRRLAENALNQITAMANESLQKCGIDLSVNVKWCREGNGLADECSICGAAFPKGKSIKECLRCHSPRGAKTIDKIEVILSDISGAAEDLCGVVISLAAAAWLKNRRNSTWGVVLVDEAFGALDLANSSALSSNFAALIKEGGFEQGFLVAHTRAVTDTMPGRITVIAGENGSTVKVG